MSIFSVFSLYLKASGIPCKVIDNRTTEQRREGTGEGAVDGERGWHCSDWSHFVSGEELLRSDYLGRTKCFCWWRVAVISGSWEIDGTHRALAHWSRPRHWQSMAWLAMRENEAKWATCESVSLSLLRVVDAALLLVSFVLTSLALEWLIITRSKVWALCVFLLTHMCVCIYVCYR